MDRRATSARSRTRPGCTSLHGAPLGRARTRERKWTAFYSGLFLGYRLRLTPEGETEVLLSERSEKRLREQIIELTPRKWGQSLWDCIHAINVYLGGWFGHFGICTAGVERVIHQVDAHIRRRLRAIVLRHWGTKQTIARRLTRQGIKWKTAWRRVYEGRKSTWNLSKDFVVQNGLRNVYFTERGLLYLEDRFGRDPQNLRRLRRGVIKGGVG